MGDRFAWYELRTADTNGAIAFYSTVVGWSTRPVGEAAYTMWVGSQGPLGGIADLPEAAKRRAASSFWLGYVAVADVEATVASIEVLGGRVHAPPAEIPEVGRFAVIIDPQGAALAVIQPRTPMARHDPRTHGEFAWNELTTTDSAAAFEFYRGLFGWTKVSELDMGELGTYVIFGEREQQHGGMRARAPDMQSPPSWSYSIHVDDLEAAIDRAIASGGNLLFGPTHVPDGSRFARLLDAQGALFALHGPAAG